MELTPKILIVGPDPKLTPEVEAAMSVISDLRPVVHTVYDYRQGLEALRSRRPDMVMIEMGTDVDSVKLFAEEAQMASPETAIVAVFYPSIFGPDISESALLIDALRAGIQDFLPRPLSSTDLDRFLDRMFRRQAVATEPRQSGRVVSFVANKGGVGKSTLSVNLACGLAQRFPDRVLLIDASLQMGVCAPMLNLNPATTIVDTVRERDRLDETLLRELAVSHSCGLDLLAAPKSAVEAAEIDDEMMSLILTLARRTYDYIVVDTFPMLDSAMMAVLDLTDQAYVVTESVVPTLLAGKKMIELLDELGFPASRRKLILNRYSTFPGNLRADAVVKRIGYNVDHIVPYQKRLLIASNLGTPYILETRNRFFGFGKCMVRLIDEVTELHPASIDWRRSRGRFRSSVIGAGQADGAVQR